MAWKRCVGVALAIFPIALVACSNGADDAESAGADLSSSAAQDSSPPGIAKRLLGQWTPKGDAGNLRAYVMRELAGDPPNMVDAFRDFTHKPTDATDKVEVDRVGVDVHVVTSTASAAGPTGTIDLRYIERSHGPGFKFAPTRQELYNFELTNAGGVETLVLTQTAAKRLDEALHEITDPKLQVDLKAEPLRPRTEFIRPPSWCAVTRPADLTEIGFLADCGSELMAGSYTPTKIPEGCDGFNGVRCTTCEKNRCGLRQISTCEHAGFECKASAAECTTPRSVVNQFSGSTFTITGTVETKDRSGIPIDCGHSPTGGSACCHVDVN